MSRLTTTPLAVSADYADALLAARRAKSWLFFFLMIGLIVQIAVFFVAKFTSRIEVGPGGQATVTTSVDKGPTTTTTTAETSEPNAHKSTSITVTGGVLAWIVNAITYLGTIFSIVLVIVVLLIVLIMLVGRLIGVAHTTSAFTWAVLLAVLLFPWQLFYERETARSGSNPQTNEIRLDDYRWPGAFYTWGELRQGLDFENGVNKVAILRYARFAGFPMVTLIILFMVQAKSGRGVKYALGEADVHVDVTTTDL